MDQATKHKIEDEARKFVLLNYVNPSQGDFLLIMKAMFIAAEIAEEAHKNT